MVMRAFRALFLIFVSLATASAADLKVKVIDPHSAAVSCAQVYFLSRGTQTSQRIATTTAEGFATFDVLNSSELYSGGYLVHVIALGFALQSSDDSESHEL